MYIARFDNNILIMCKTASGMGVYKEGSRIRHRTVPIPYFYARESTEEWDPTDLKNDVNGYEHNCSFKISYLNELIMKHQREGFMLYNEHKMIYETFNKDISNLDYMKERLLRGGRLSKAKQIYKSMQNPRYLPLYGSYGLPINSLPANLWLHCERDHPF